MNDSSHLAKNAAPRPARIVATPKAYAIITDPARPPIVEAALNKIISLALYPPARKVGGYQYQGCPVNVIAQWALSDAEESVLLLMAWGDGFYREGLEDECISIPIV